MQPEKEEEKKILLDGTDPFGHLDLIIEKKIAVVFKYFHQLIKNEQRRTNARINC